MRFSHILAVPTLALLCATLGACGGEDPLSFRSSALDSGLVERELVQRIAEREDVSEIGVDATCPRKVDAEVGSRFLCTIDAGNGETFHAQVSVPQEGVGEDDLDVTIVADVQRRQTERRMARHLAEEYGLYTREVDVVCPAGVPAIRGQEIDCVANTDEGEKVAMQAIVTSDDPRRVALDIRIRGQAA